MADFTPPTIFSSRRRRQLLRRPRQISFALSLLTVAITLAATAAGCADATGFGLTDEARGPSGAGGTGMVPGMMPSTPSMPTMPPGMMPGEMPSLPADPMVMPPMPPANTPFDPAALDRQAAPCQDFFRFACGGWQKTNALTAGQGSVSTFSLTSSRVSVELARLIDQAIADGASASGPPDARRVASYNQACLAAPTQPGSRAMVKTIIAKVDPVTNLEQVARVAGELRTLGLTTFVATFVLNDPADTNRHLLTTDHGAIMLQRDAYLNPELAFVLDEYRLHIQRLATILEVTIDPMAVVRVETALARGELTPEQRQNQLNITNRLPMAEVQALAPRFAWGTYLQTIGYGPLPAMNVRVPSYLKQLETTLAMLPVDDLKHYMRWQIADRLAPLLDQPVLDEEFKFHDRLAGKQQPLARRGVCRSLVLGAHTDVIARRYVEKHFDGKTREDTRKMIASIRAALHRRIAGAAWLDPPTRMEALAKLAALADKVGHPDQWAPPPMPLEVRSLLEDRLTRSQEDSKGNVRAISAMLDRSVWFMSPFTVNAAYLASLNQTLVPAAILQPPFFHVSRSPLANYAAIGSIIGHELTHAFDSSGRHFDGTGSLRQWWSPAVNSEFDRRSQCVVDAWGKHEALPGKFVNGKLTLGENIADLGGLRVALEAFLQDAPAAPMVDGFDARQQFFIASAQVWCTNLTDAAASNQLVRDDHAPNRARVNVTLAHTPEFAQAFSCPAGSPMVAANRCEIW